MSPHIGRRSLSARLVETVKFYGPLGFTSFGGPSANIVLIRKVSAPIGTSWLAGVAVALSLWLSNDPSSPAIVLFADFRRQRALAG